MPENKIYKSTDYVSQNEAEDSKIYVHKNVNILFDSNLIQKSSPYLEKSIGEKNINLDNL